MSRELFLDLALKGLPAPLVSDLVLHEEADPEAARRDGRRLAAVLERAAHQWDLPIALPLMDLRLEKADLLSRVSVSEEDADRFHFESVPDQATKAALKNGPSEPCPASQARDQALSHLRQKTNLLPIGMVIGPFSLTTKLMADPITAVALLGSGADEPQVQLLLACLEVAETIVAQSIRRQISAGAGCVLLCEPTASISFISPRQLRAGSPILEKLVLEPNARIKAMLDEAGVDLIFHDCGELTREMVQAFATRLHPAVLSLGSSRDLAEDAKVIPGDVVLYGNLPTKSFYSDSAMPLEEVRQRSIQLSKSMRDCGHPHILGSECDVLFVPEAAATIKRKVQAIRSVTVEV